jgi:predicted transcriptional regulator
MPLASTSLKLDSDVKDRLQKLATEKRRSANWLMGEAIREFVEHHEVLAQFDRDTRKALTEYDATGKYISGEAVDAWLARLEAGEDVPPPEPE